MILTRRDTFELVCDGASVREHLHLGQHLVGRRIDQEDVLHAGIRLAAGRGDLHQHVDALRAAVVDVNSTNPE